MIKFFTYIGMVILICLMANDTVIGQQRFSAGFIGGLTAAQIDGDADAGFNKVGLTGGLKASAFLTDKIDLSFEILFSQRGSTAEIDTGSSFDRQRLHLNYVQVPVIAGYNDWYDEEEDFYHIKFLLGFSYGRLISFNFDDNWPLSVVNNLNENNFSWLVGATYYVNPNIGFTVRYNSFISLLFNTKDFPNTNAESLRSRYLDFQAMYIF